MKKLLASVIAFAMLLTLCAVFASAEDSYEKIFDLGEEKVILSVTYTPANASGLSKVTVLGSADGENFFKLNAEADVAVTDGAATFTLEMSGGKHRAFLNIRYIKVVGAADVEGEIAYTTVELPEGAEAIDPAGPYAVTGLNGGGYGAAVFTAADAPEGGFDVNAQDAFTSNDKPIKLNSSMITIAEKQDDGKYKILWNDSNGWTAETGATHTNSPEGAAGVTYQDGKVVLQENQILMVVISSGGYETVNDGVYSTLKWILRGQSAGDVFSLTESGDGYSLTLGAGEAAPVEESSDEPAEPLPENLENLAEGKSYTVADNNPRGDGYDDNETGKLTDGIVGIENSATDLLGLKATEEAGGVLTTVIDLGEVKDFLAIRAYAVHYDGWGIPAPVKVTFAVSEDGENYSDAIEVPADKAEILAGEGAGEGWEFPAYIAQGEFTGRYVKVCFCRSGAGHVWVSEVQVLAEAAAPVEESSEPAEESTPAEESKPVTPTTGDAGIIALAVVSVIALGGAVVVKKVK